MRWPQRTRHLRVRPGSISTGTWQQRSLRTRSWARRMVPSNGHDQVGESEDEAQFLLESLDNLDENVEGYEMTDRLESCFQILKDMHYLPRDILLIGSCSTVCLICNRELLHGIHKVNKGLSVRCNAGVRTTQLKGYLGDFPEPVGGGGGGGGG